MRANLIVRHKQDDRVLQLCEVNVFDPMIKATIDRIEHAYRGEAKVDASQVDMARTAYRRQFTQVA